MAVLLLGIVVLAEVQQSQGNGLSKRFIIPDLLVHYIVPTKYKREECILCKCFQECHSEGFQVDEENLCRDYKDSITCSEIDRCTCCNDLKIFKSCEHGGTCRNLGQGQFTCDCPAGFYGHRCEHAGTQPQQQQNDYCASTPCLNGASCTNGQNSFVCNCANGWTGQRCDKDIDECLNNPCQNGGKCVNTQGTYTCSCTTGWSGTNCVTDSLPACNHACSLEPVVKSQAVENTLAGLCPATSSRASNEALLMQCCQIGRSGTWRQGLQVKQHCQDSKIPPYTPVSEFINGQLMTDKAGVFTTCLADGSGFKMIIQQCNSTPKLIQVNGANAENYFVIY